MKENKPKGKSLRRRKPRSNTYKRTRSEIDVETNNQRRVKTVRSEETGAPVIEINVDDSQLEDSLDDAIQMFNEYHFDGVERVFINMKSLKQIFKMVLLTPIPSEPLDQMDILKLKIQKNLFL